MKRLIESQLHVWGKSSRRKPLIVRGARQVGKTYTICQYGKAAFADVVYVDLERRRQLHHLFEGDLEPRSIVAQLEVLLDVDIVLGKTLLFFDEIQACPRAITALRYFYEDMPQLHVIAAGSLLEFALGEVSIPVGRVQYLDMHPMIFAEFLLALGKDASAKLVLSTPKKHSDAIDQMLFDHLRLYCWVGGMPEAVQAYVDTQSLKVASQVHEELCNAFRQDFGKYAPRMDPQCLDAVFSGAGQSMGRQVQYVQLAEGYSSPTKKKAFDLLTMARVVKKVPAVDPSGLPLGASASLKKFKAIFLDVGLWQHLCGMNIEKEFAKTNLLDMYQGALAEQFVGQELMVSQKNNLFYWARNARGSTAEVDYVAVVDEVIHPVEVKSGASGRLRSMHSFLAHYPNCGDGLVCSSRPYETLPEQKLVFLPLYGIYGATCERRSDKCEQI